MNKVKLIPVIFFFLCINILARDPGSKNMETPPIITGIGFIDGSSYKPSAPPEALLLGIDITDDANYKLSYGDKIINGGLLKKGSNRVGIGAQDLFKASGTHVYLLETKAGEFNFKYEIIIDITLKLPPPPKISLEIDSVKPFQYETEMYIDGRLAFKTRKWQDGVISDSMKRDIKRALEADPQNPAAISNPNTIATIQIPVTSIINSIFKRRKFSSLPKPRRISLSFLEKDKAGTRKKVNAELELHYRILK